MKQISFSQADQRFPIIGQYQPWKQRDCEPLPRSDQYPYARRKPERQWIGTLTACRVDPGDRLAV